MDTFRNVLNKQVTEFYPTWKKAARSITRGADTATDLLHMVIESLYDGRGERMIKEGGNLNGYVLRAMKISFVSGRSTYHNLYRRLDNEISLDTTDWITTRDEGTGFEKKQSRIQNALRDNPVDNSARILNESIDSLISRLPAIESELYRLYILPGFSYEDLAASTGIPKAYLYNRIKRATAKLKRYAVLC